LHRQGRLLGHEIRHLTIKSRLLTRQTRPFSGEKLTVDTRRPSSRPPSAPCGICGLRYLTAISNNKLKPKSVNPFFHLSQIFFHDPNIISPTLRLAYFFFVVFVLPFSHFSYFDPSRLVQSRFYFSPNNTTRESITFSSPKFVTSKSNSRMIRKLSFDKVGKSLTCAWTT